jgi:hypothetical protein
MKQKIKKEITLDQAIMVYDLNNYLHIDHLAAIENSNYREIERQMTEEYDSYSPEDLVMEADIENKKKELFNSLSQEAQEIVNIISDCPKELTSICFAGNTEKVVLSKFMSLIRKQWKQRLVVHQIFKEVFNYANKIKAFNEV